MRINLKTIANHLPILLAKPMLTINRGIWQLRLGRLELKEIERTCLAFCFTYIRQVLQ